MMSKLTAIQKKKWVQMPTEIKSPKKVYNGSGSIGLTLDSKGRSKLTEDYEGTIKTYEDKDTAREGSLQNAVALIFTDITPKFINEEVKIDDKEKDLKPIVEMIKGSYAKAAEELKR